MTTRPDSEHLICRFNLKNSAPDPEKLPKRLQHVLQQGNDKYRDTASLLDTVNSIHRQFYFRMWLAALPCSITYILLIIAFCIGFIVSIVAIWKPVSEKPIYLLIPGGIILAMIVVILVFVTVVPVIFANPLQRLAVFTMRKYLIPKLNSSERYASSPFEFRLLTCVTNGKNSVIKHEEKVRLNPSLASSKIQVSQKSTCSDLCDFIFDCTFCGGSSGGHSGEAECIMCILGIVALFFSTFACICAGYSCLDLFIERGGMPAGLWLEVWLKPSSGITFPPDGETLSSTKPDDEHLHLNNQNNTGHLNGHESFYQHQYSQQQHMPPPHVNSFIDPGYPYHQNGHPHGQVAMHETSYYHPQNPNVPMAQPLYVDGMPVPHSYMQPYPAHYMPPMMDQQQAMHHQQHPQQQPISSAVSKENRAIQQKD